MLLCSVIASNHFDNSDGVWTKRTVWYRVLAMVSRADTFDCSNLWYPSCWRWSGKQKGNLADDSDLSFEKVTLGCGIDNEKSIHSCILPAEPW